MVSGRRKHIPGWFPYCMISDALLDSVATTDIDVLSRSKIQRQKAAVYCS